MSDHLHVVIIGGQRCGSTLLAETLERHPDVSGARPARPEPKFFLESYDHEEYHRRHFRLNCPVYLEKSTTYLERPECIINMNRMSTDLLTIVILRDPVDRAISNWRFSTANGLESLPADQALTEKAEDRPFSETMSTSPYHYLKRSRYSRLLDPWLNDPELARPEIVLFEQLVDNPIGVLRALEERLALTSPLRFDPAPINATELGSQASSEIVSRLRHELFAEAAYVESLVPLAAKYWPTISGLSE